MVPLSFDLAQVLLESVPDSEPQVLASQASRKKHVSLKSYLFGRALLFINEYPAHHARYSPYHSRSNDTTSHDTQREHRPSRYVSNGRPFQATHPCSYGFENVGNREKFASSNVHVQVIASGQSDTTVRSGFFSTSSFIRDE